MNLRLDFLRPEERRYAGAVSKPFAIKAGASLLVGLLILAVFLLVLRNTGQRAEWADARRRWKELEPEIERIDTLQSLLEADRRLAAELTSWGEARLEWAPILRRLQERLPADMQLTKLHVLGSFEMTGRPPRREEDPPQVPARVYVVQMEGRVGGPLADEVVVDFIHLLRDDPVFADCFESVQLQGLRREILRGAATDQPAFRAFSIELKTRQRLMP